MSGGPKVIGHRPVAAVRPGKIIMMHGHRDLVATLQENKHEQADGRHKVGDPNVPLSVKSRAHCAGERSLERHHSTGPDRRTSLSPQRIHYVPHDRDLYGVSRPLAGPQLPGTPLGPLIKAYEPRCERARTGPDERSRSVSLEPAPMLLCRSPRGTGCVPPPTVGRTRAARGSMPSPGRGIVGSFPGPSRQRHYSSSLVVPPNEGVSVQLTSQASASACLQADGSYLVPQTVRAPVCGRRSPERKITVHCGVSTPLPDGPLQIPGIAGAVPSVPSSARALHVIRQARTPAPGSVCPHTGGSGSAVAPAGNQDRPSCHRSGGSGSAIAPAGNQDRSCCPRTGGSGSAVAPAGNQDRPCCPRSGGCGSALAPAGNQSPPHANTMSPAPPVVIGATHNSERRRSCAGSYVGAHAPPPTRPSVGAELPWSPR